MTVIGLDISGRSPDAMVNDRRRLIRHQFLQYDRASSQWAQGLLDKGGGCQSKAFRSQP